MGKCAEGRGVPPNWALRCTGHWGAGTQGSVWGWLEVWGRKAMSTALGTEMTCAAVRWKGGGKERSEMWMGQVY